jgi:hypothetical protein
MIKIEYLRDCTGASKFGTCMGCGKGSQDDPSMIRLTISNNNSGHIQGTSICLCNRCRVELYHVI